jgi:hypothetical protein
VKFPITIKAGSQIFLLTVELVHSDQDFETFKIYPNNKPEKHVLIQGNRPMLRRKGLKHKAIKWAVNGEVRYQSNVDQAIKLIEQHLEPPPGKAKIIPFTPPPPQDRKKKRPSGHTLGEKMDKNKSSDETQAG